MNQKDFFKAIYALYSNVVLIRSDDDSVVTAYDENNNVVSYDLDAIQAHIQANAYQSKRAAEYPSIAEQLDAIWKGGDAAEEMLAKVQAVKLKYPKE